MNNSNFVISPIADPDPESTEPTEYALVVADVTAVRIGPMAEVVDLRNKLNALIERDEHGEILYQLDERLGHKWLTTGEAAALVLKHRGESITTRTIRAACESGAINPAERSGWEWRFPYMRFWHWYANRPKPGPKPKKS